MYWVSDGGYYVTKFLFDVKLSRNARAASALSVRLGIGRRFVAERVVAGGVA